MQGVVCMYNTSEISVAHAVPSTMVRVTAEGAGVHAMVLGEVHDAGAVHIEE